MKDIFHGERQTTVSDVYDSHADVVLFEGDCSALLADIPSESVDLVITSPPYNIGKSYEKSTSLEAYLQSQELVIAELDRVLTPAGSLCWQVGNYVSKGEVFPLDIYFYDLFKRRGLKLRNRIIWRFNHGLHASKRFSGRYETLLWFTKQDEYVFNLDPVRIPPNIPGSAISKAQSAANLPATRSGRIPPISGISYNLRPAWSAATPRPTAWP